MTSHSWAVKVNTRREIPYLRTPMYYSLFTILYWWNTLIFPFTKKSYLHHAVKILFLSLMCKDIDVSPWLLTWLANYKRDSRSGAQPVLFKFHSQNGFEVWRRYSYRWLSGWAAKFSHWYFFQALHSILVTGICDRWPL